jgi:hypothetical protein
LATLAIVGLCPAWGQSGVAADEPKPADPAPPDAEKIKNPDFASPITSVNAFLAALKANDLDQLAEATAIRAPSEAEGKKNQELFMAILEQRLSDSGLRKLASEFEGYKIVGTKNRGGGPRMGILVAKAGTNGERFERTVTVRHERKGWKIVDFSEPKELEKR